MQYGFDSAAIGALQAMPGFLAVFGYKDPSNPIGYNIDVNEHPVLALFVLLLMIAEHCSTIDNLVADIGIISFLARCRCLFRLSGTSPGALVSLHSERCGMRNSNCDHQ